MSSIEIDQLKLIRIRLHEAMESVDRKRKMTGMEKNEARKQISRQLVAINGAIDLALRMDEDRFHFGLREAPIVLDALENDVLSGNRGGIEGHRRGALIHRLRTWMNGVSLKGESDG